MLLVSVAHDEAIANGNSATPDISPDGQHVAFESSATTLRLSRTRTACRYLRAPDRGWVTWTAGSFNAICYKRRSARTGKRVAFHTSADNLGPADANGTSDIYVKRYSTGTILRVSEPTGGGEADGGSRNAKLIYGGQVAAYQSSATNLVATPTTESGPDLDIFMSSELLEGTLGDQSRWRHL